MSVDVPESAGRPAPLHVYVHVHYLDVWQDMARMIAARLGEPFRLVVTTSHRAAEVALPETPFLRDVRILHFENRGRDILPFLQAMAADDSEHVGLKLHTKRSEHRLDGEDWRRAILSSLMPSSEGTRAIAAKLRDDPRIGIVAPDGSLYAVAPWLMRNFSNMQRAGRLLHIPIERADLSDARFAAGSMFWFRRSALSAFADERLYPLFAQERRQVDATMAHAVERLFGIEAGRQRRVILDVTGLHASKPSMYESDLDALAHQGVQRSLAMARAPTRAMQWADRYFPPALSLYRALPDRWRRRVKALLHG